MKTLLLLSLALVIFWVFFRPISKKKFDRYYDKNTPDTFIGVPGNRTPLKKEGPVRNYDYMNLDYLKIFYW